MLGDQVEVERTVKIICGWSCDARKKEKKELEFGDEVRKKGGCGQ